MRIPLAASLAVLSVVLGPPVHAQDTEFWDFLESGQVLTRCEDSSLHQRAAASLRELDDRIERLTRTDPPGPIVEALHALLRTDCFLLSAEAGRLPEPDSSESLKLWWRDGGHAWLESYLELPRLGYLPDLQPHVIVPPDPHRTLYLDGHRDHPLSEFLCAAADETCGAATRGWALRADAYFELHRAARGNEFPAEIDERPAQDAAHTARECAGAAAGTPPEEHYRAWRECLEGRRPRRSALPLGAFRAPDAGWILISGRRGHYDFCDTTSAYDLASGAAFVHESCSALALKRDGAVDRSATNRARRERLKTGAVSVENLREAVWMMLFRGEVERLQLDPAAYPLPGGVTPRITWREGRTISSVEGPMINSAQTVLTWRWVPPAGGAFLGEIVWPDGSDAGEAHAVSLLKITEAGLVEGCAPSLPPPPAEVGGRKAVNLNDVPAESVQDLDKDYTRTFREWRGMAPCRRGPR